VTKREVARILARARHDPLPFMERTLWIVNKARQLVRLKLNAPQRKVHAKVMEQIRAGKPVRINNLKARREGMSTYAEALIFTMMLCYPRSRASVLTHERDLSQEIATMSHLYLEQLDSRLRPTGPPPTLNKMELERIVCDDGDIDLDSRLTVDTSTGKESGRGKRFDFLHLSEAAFYPDLDRTMRALMPTVPNLPGTIIFIETTANGIGNAYHKLWTSAVAGDSQFAPIFIPWFDLDEYAIEPPPDFRPTEDEAHEAKLYSLSHAQLYWRRCTIRDSFNGDEDAFNQEYPPTPEAAFISSGSPAFSKRALMEYRKKAEVLTYKTGDLTWEHGKTEGPPTFHVGAEGRFRIWEMPRPGREYLIGADTALGVENGDASAAAVLCRNTNRFVAEWWGRIDPRNFAYVLAKLGYFYHGAILAPETNNTGLTTLVELTQHLTYPAIFRWQKYDNLRQVYTDKLGWQTNQYSRPMLIDDMQYALRERLIGLVSVQMIGELSIFDAGPTRVADDDLAIAALIAWHAHLITPMADGNRPRAILENMNKPADPIAPDVVSEREYQNVQAFLKRMGRPSEPGGTVGELVEATFTGPEADPWPEIPW
jgi:hypothetical protein